MTTFEIEALLQRCECEALDFKRDRYPLETEEAKANLLKDILAMANTIAACDKFIVIGVEEKEGRAVRICGVDPLEDNNVQQLVNSNTNRPVRFRIENYPYQDANLTVISIHQIQKCPLYLTRTIGSLKKEEVYLRRGSTNAKALPDEIAEMGREQSARTNREQQVDQFWIEFKALLKDLEEKVRLVKNTGAKIYDSTIAECRLPRKHAEDLLKQAHVLDLGAQFCQEFEDIIKKVQTIDRYMDMGADTLNKWLGNFNSYAEQLYAFLLTLQQNYLK